MKYFYYYNSKGWIKSRSHCCDEDYDLQQAPLGFTKKEGAPDLETEYAPNGVQTKRPTMTTVIDKTTITADTSDKATITKVPKGTKVIIAGVDQGMCDDGTVEINADFKGSYKVKLVCWPYLDKEITVDAS